MDIDNAAPRPDSRSARRAHEARTRARRARMPQDRAKPGRRPNTRPTLASMFSEVTTA